MSALEIIPLTATPVCRQQNEDALALSIALGAGLIFIIGVLNYAIDRQTHRHAEEKLAALERTDVLTGLPNRLAANEELERRVQAARPGEFFAVLAIEVMNIGAINQQFGVSIADRVIQSTSTRLIDARQDRVCSWPRVSGSQFCGIGAVSGPADTLLQAQKIQTVLSQDLLIEGRDIQVDARIGAATFPSDADNVESLFRKAQAALARAVADPLEPVALHDEGLDVTAQRRLALANDLRGALERHEFELHYQPQVWIDGRQIIGYEALIRWRHPQLGMVSPAEFIPMAERTGLILPIGDWVLRTACEEATKWPKEFRVAVNLSPLQLRQADLPLLGERSPEPERIGA